jgi:hypothetical protein
VLGRDDTNGPITGVLPYITPQDYRSDLEIYTVEAQHLFQAEPWTFILGGRYQNGHFDTRNKNTIIPYVNDAGVILEPDNFNNPVQDFHSDFERLDLYSYLHWQVLDTLRLIGGVGYDRLTYPVNFRRAPISDQADTIDQVSPKAGFIFTPWKDTVLRAGYGRSLGGVSIDQSFRLEPSQVAGFNHAWRSIIPESVSGANSAERFENVGVSLEQRFPTRTYVALAAERLESKVHREVGAFDLGPPDLSTVPTPPFINQSGTREELDFVERSLIVSINQLVKSAWSFGASYRLSQAELDDLFPDIPTTATTFGGFRRQQHLEARLHQLRGFALYNHRSGLFAQLDSVWSKQSNSGYSPELAGEDFWQFNAAGGYRFARRQAEVRVGVLNFTDQDYRLNPLNLTYELPRERTLFVSCRFSF